MARTRNIETIQPEQPGFITIGDIRAVETARETCRAGGEWFRRQFGADAGPVAPRDVAQKLIDTGYQTWGSYLLNYMYPDFAFIEATALVREQVPELALPDEGITAANAADVAEQLRQHPRRKAQQLADQVWCRSCRQSHMDTNITSDEGLLKFADYIAAQAPKTEPEPPQETTTMNITRDTRITRDLLRQMGAPTPWTRDFERAYPQGTTADRLLADNRLNPEQREWLNSRLNRPTTPNIAQETNTQATADNTFYLTADMLRQMGVPGNLVQEFTTRYGQQADVRLVARTVPADQLIWALTRKWTGAVYTILGKVLAQYQSYLNDVPELMPYVNNVTRKNHTDFADDLSTLALNPDNVPEQVRDLVAALPDMLDSPDMYNPDPAAVLGAIANSGLATWPQMAEWAAEHIIAREAKRQARASR